MKKVFAILLVSAVLSACGGGSKSGGSADSSAAADQTAKAQEPNVDTAVNNTGSSTTTAELAPGAKLMAGSDCNTCHKADVKVVGPALKDIAAKYPPTDANIDSLTNKVIKGGSGHWGDIPMAPHPQLAKNDVKEMVKYILSLKK
ncbi:MAG TPA: c-type cytochrome [Mucilaginibacter sp.]|nr:c-type cytochrome [Mucilaginibacter sp.]